MTVPFDDRLGVHQQSEGFTSHQAWDFAGTPADAYPLLLRYPYFDLYRKQVVKQADLVLAMYLCTDEFTEEQKARNFAYYEALTVRDSSLSACVQSVLAAEVGHAELARDYLGEAALMDIANLEHNTKRRRAHRVAGRRVAGAGRRVRRHAPPSRRAPAVRPVPAAGHHAARVPPVLPRPPGRVEVTDSTATYTLLEGEPIEIGHYGDLVTLYDESAAELSRAGADATGHPDAPTQPPGREPRRRPNEDCGVRLPNAPRVLAEPDWRRGGTRTCGG